MDIDFSKIKDFAADLEAQTGLTEQHLLVLEVQLPPRFRDIDNILEQRPQRSHRKDRERVDVLVSVGLMEHGKREPAKVRLTRDGHRLVEMFWSNRCLQEMSKGLGRFGITGVQFG